MTKKEKNRVAKDVRRQNRYLCGEIERMKTKLAEDAEHVAKMTLDHVHRQDDYATMKNQLSDQLFALNKLEARIEARYTWPFLRRLRFLVSAK